MNSENYFPGNNVVNWYITAEDMLVNVLDVIPYCTEHEKVWSPKLVTILQETCSQLDSLWRYELSQLNQYSQASRVDIKNYFEHFGACMSQKWVVFWGEKAIQVKPFDTWKDLTEDEFKAEKYDKVPKLKWWKAYQAVKHDRLTNRNRATLNVTVDALAGLFLAIIKCKGCRDAIAQKNWASWDGGPVNLPFNPFESLDEDFGLVKVKNISYIYSTRMVIESKLFA